MTTSHGIEPARQASTSEKLTNEHKRVLGGALVGTTIEWFDFFIYAQAAGLIFATQFFNPVADSSPGLAQIIAWASLGISFLFRPFGAILAGHLGDRIGRKPVLVLTLVGMGLATFLMGLLPNYEAWGIAAPILLVVLRIVQGMSAGGEWGGAALIAVEHAPVLRRGYFGAFPQLGVPLGMMLATIMMLTLTAAMTPEQFETWGWRIPFLSSLALILVGFFIRRSVEESPVFTEMEQLRERSSAPLKDLFAGYSKLVAQCALIFAGNNAAGYLLIAFFVSYGSQTLGFARPVVLGIMLLGSGAWFISTLVSGHISDVIGRRAVFFWGYVALILWSLPQWVLVDSGEIFLFALATIVLGILLGVTYGPQSALYAEMFPASVRLSGLNISYALGSIIGGAFAPMISQMILEQTGNAIYIGVYIAVLCVCSMLAVVAVPKGIQGRALGE
ncbi:MFS transporter [Corynebacterium hadale]|uniref:MFS transporter n=1 Tax=Corynebacterium hadale TaxID=2026255 RepID=A0ABX4H9Y2_9CORY|nr:MFS transporter [Corynebacterium hadale]PAT06091.1 MFS transporter [Corynebacterium hadale]